MNSETAPPVSEGNPSPAVAHARVDVSPRRDLESGGAEDSFVDRSRRLVERWCLVVLTTLAVLYTLYFARAILLPITLAIVVSLVLKPITKRLDRLGLPSMVSATIVLLLFAVAIGGGGRALWEPANQWIAQAPESLKTVGEQLRSVSGPLKKIQEAKTEVDKITAMSDEGGEEGGGALVTPPPVSVQVEQPSLTVRLLNSTGGFATAVVIVLSLLFFLLASGDQFLEKAVQIRRTWREKRDTVLLAKEIERKISTYLAAITIINIGLGIVIGAGLWMIGMPNPVLWGVLAALLNYIPFAGLVLGTCIVSVVAIAEFGSLGHAMLAPAVYLGANGVEANVITPAILGRSISLNPVVILLAVFLGGWLWGIGGIFLSVPILLIFKIVCDSTKSLEPIGVLLAR